MSGAIFWMLNLIFLALCAIVVLLSGPAVPKPPRNPEREREIAEARREHKREMHRLEAFSRRMRKSGFPDYPSL